MKKNLIPMLIMSIISLLLSLGAVFAGLGMYEFSTELDSMSSETENSFDDFIALFGSIFIYIIIVMLAFAFVIAAVMGAFGLACAINKGRFALPCIVFGSAGTLLCIILIIAAIAGGDFSPFELIPAIYFTLYAASAVTAFRYRKNVKENHNERSTEEYPITQK